MIGSVIKSKIELLLKLLSAHLQIKFFAISVIGLLLNLVRFWLDIKGGHGPQKVSSLNVIRQMLNSFHVLTLKIS